MANARDTLVVENRELAVGPFFDAAQRDTVVRAAPGSFGAKKAGTQ